MAAAPSSSKNGAAAPSSSEAEKESDVPTGAGSSTDVPNGQGALMNPGEFFQPLVSIASTTPTQQVSEGTYIEAVSSVSHRF